MVHPCEKLCDNKTASGYCATTACINPKYSNISTAQYGKGDQKRIVTNADRLRSMSDEELAAWLCDVAGWLPAFEGRVHPILEWLQQEAPHDQP